MRTYRELAHRFPPFAPPHGIQLFDSRTSVYCERENPLREPHDVARTTDTGISMDFSTRLGYRLGRQIIRPIIVAGAWSAAPPTSFSLLPYGPRFPINPGDFFQPLSLLVVVGLLGALISGLEDPV
jgi:hypothetical protein